MANVVVVFAWILLGAFGTAAVAAEDRTQVNIVPALNQVAGAFYTFGADPSAGGKRILFVGNSITLHGPRPSIGWTNSCGMAASDLGHDYVHRFAERMSAREPKTSYALFQVAGSVERGFTNDVWLTEKVFGPVRDYRPDVIFLFFGANVPRAYDNNPTAFPHRFGKTVVDMVRFVDPARRAKVFISEGYYKRPLLDAEKVVAAHELGATMVRMSDIRANGATRGRFNHPNDYGMKCIADRFWDALCGNRAARPVESVCVPYDCRGEGLAHWTNDMTSVRSACLTPEGLEVRTASWKGVGLAADIPDRLRLGPDDELVFRARATCPSTGRPAVRGTIWPCYAGEKGFANDSTALWWTLDGAWHEYSVRPFDGARGRELLRLKIGLPPEARNSGVIVLSDIVIRHRPVAPAFTVMTAEADAFARVGAPVGLRVRVWNRGTSPAAHATLTPAAPLPAGVRWIVAPGVLTSVPADSCGNFRCSLVADKPISFVPRFTLAAEGVAQATVEVPVRIEAAPPAVRADYVPEPKPPKCDYEIAACYFPGWMELSRWKKIERMCPERKPLLGWYDETNPEVVDWQIKWYSEHGIGILMMDWYWNRGDIRLDHWLKAFARAKWRRYMKWAVMWCNESQKPNHSAEDNRRLVRYWIDNYFKMPEYYRIDDKPVVGIFVPEHLERDLGVQGTKDMLVELRRATREAGYKGLYLIGYTRPVDDADGNVSRHLRDLGFDGAAIYNSYGHFGAAESTRRYAWKHVEETSPRDWENRAKASLIPFWPMIGTGRDERPWVNRLEVYGRTSASFGRMCRAMRTFADEKGIRRIQLGPLNEWGEGSYIEPCVEFGFGMFDALRDAFCDKPEGGWPTNVVPSDLGLGPYDFPPNDPAPRADEPLDLTDGKSHGWSALGSHAKTPKPTSEGLRVTAATVTPAILCDYEPFASSDYDRLVVRMKCGSKAGSFRFYWRSEELQWSEASCTTCSLAQDGDWHDYVFDMSKRPAWTGRIFELRLQPDGKPPFDYVISRITFERKK